MSGRAFEKTETERYIRVRKKERKKKKKMHTLLVLLVVVLPVVPYRLRLIHLFWVYPIAHLAIGTARGRSLGHLFLQRDARSFFSFFLCARPRKKILVTKKRGGTRLSRSLSLSLVCLSLRPHYLIVAVSLSLCACWLYCEGHFVPYTLRPTGKKNRREKEKSLCSPHPHSQNL